MAFAREIFIQIKNVIRFQQSEKESDSHYTVLGNTLVRVSNHCTYMYVWENFFKIHPKQRGMKILSLVFEDNKDTFHPNCLVTQHNLSKPIMVEEYVYPLHSNPQYLSKVDVNAIIKSLQNLERTNRFNEPTGKAQRYVRKSLNPTTQNITTDNSGIPTFSSEFGYGDDAVSESKNNESKNTKNMKKNVIKLNENTLRKIVAESVKKVLRESYEDSYEYIDDNIKKILEHIHGISDVLFQIHETVNVKDKNFTNFDDIISTLMMHNTDFRDEVMEMGVKYGLAKGRETF